jgi:RNA polymerase sigma-70 factor (ECF subfamily)
MVRAHGTALFRYAFWLCRDRALAEDLVQETFLRAWRFREGLRERAKAKAWLITTVRREHARLYERYRPEFVEIGPEQIADYHAPRDAELEPWELRRAIAALPVKLREPLILQVVFGYNGEEIAQILGVPRSTANTRLFRARQQLRKAVEAAEALTARALAVTR